ncbi:hypothetical protein BTR22_19105 [Alkalihalophilus pseudofirmus]|uniref:hypothetical protein n=1 Tax=Alkalihalophilus pseudofirmus TaxID=79885 RepID=UPI000951E575|nr:hypothetical protein BTR22_19105 [Alkalihalophilus pseudofirmus]
MQLSLLVQTFDESRAHWTFNHVTKTPYCEILAFVPEDAKDHLELNYSLHKNDKEVQRKAELWEHVAYAIWCAHDCDWIEAIRLLKKHREAQKPIRMVVYEKFISALSGLEIVEYLEKKV